MPLLGIATALVAVLGIARMLDTLPAGLKATSASETTGWLLTLREGPYRFATPPDAGGSIFVDGRPATGSIHLAPDVHHVFVKDVRGGGAAALGLLWARGEAPLEAVPAWALSSRHVKFSRFATSVIVKRAWPMALWLWLGTIVVAARSGIRNAITRVVINVQQQWVAILTHGALAGLALGLFAWLGHVSGRIAANNGWGYDGPNYVYMLLQGFDTGTANSALRPLVVWLNRPALRFSSNPIDVFTWMNFVYAGVLAVALDLLFSRYNRDVAARTVFIANVFLCIATAKMFAFYPVLVDLGAYAIVALAIYAIVAERRVATAVLCVAAALSREFAIATALFGIHRDLRRRVSVWKVAATYTPALAAYAGWRYYVTQRFAGKPGPDLLTGSQLWQNLQLWTDPLFVAVFAYFLLTLVGGVSLLVIARADIAVRLIRREHEWATLACVIIAAAAMGDADIWRYLAYLLPLVTVLFAWCARELDIPRRGIGLAILVIIATLVTQRPWETLNADLYLRDWFPYYLRNNQVAGVRIWPVWGWRFLTVVGLLWLMSVQRGMRLATSTRVTHDATRPAPTSTAPDR